MMRNHLFKLTLLSISALFVHSSHAMLVRHVMNRPGTKYAAQLAQTAQKRWMETESKKVSQISSVVDNALEDYTTIPVGLRPVVGGVAGGACLAAGRVVDTFLFTAISGEFPREGRFVGVFTVLGAFAGFPASFIGGPLGTAGYVAAVIAISKK